MVKRSIKRKSIKKRKQKIKSRKQKGGAKLEEEMYEKIKEKYFLLVKKFLYKNEKKQYKIETIKGLNKLVKTFRGGRVYDFIFENSANLNKNKFIIWDHGEPNTKQFEPITAGKIGIHVYVHVEADKINLIDIITTPASSQPTY